MTAIIPPEPEAFTYNRLQAIRENKDDFCCNFSCQNEIVEAMSEFSISSIEDDKREEHVKTNQSKEAPKGDNSTKELEEKFKSRLWLITHFNAFEFDFSFNNYELNKGFRQKTKEIDEMDLDLLYMYSIFYINIFQKIEDEEVKKRCNQLKEILHKMDEIWNQEISKDKINSNEKKIKEKLMARILILFEYNLKDFSRIIKENYPFNNELVNLFQYTNISQWVEN